MGKLLKLGSYNSSRCTYFKLNCAYPVRASLNSLYIFHGVLPVVEICATLKYAVLLYKRRIYNRENEISAAALNRSFTEIKLQQCFSNNLRQQWYARNQANYNNNRLQQKPGGYCLIWPIQGCAIWTGFGLHPLCPKQEI